MMGWIDDLEQRVGLAPEALSAAKVYETIGELPDVDLTEVPELAAMLHKAVGGLESLAVLLEAAGLAPPCLIEGCPLPWDHPGGHLAAELRSLAVEQ